MVIVAIWDLIFDGRGSAGELTASGGTRDSRGAGKGQDLGRD